MIAARRIAEIFAVGASGRVQTVWRVIPPNTATA
jgi:hypothetical protein